PRVAGQHADDVGPAAAVLEEGAHGVAQVVTRLGRRRERLTELADELGEAGHQRRAPLRPLAGAADQAGRAGADPLDRLGPEGGLLDVDARVQVLGHGFPRCKVAVQVTWMRTRLVRSAGTRS